MSDTEKYLLPNEKKALLEKKMINVNGQTHLIKLIKKDAKLKKHIGKRSIYFDWKDLVIGDITGAFNPIWDDGTVEWDKLVKDILSNTKSADQIKKENEPKAGEAKIGKFIVKLPKEMKGVLGNKNTELENPRAIIDTDDADAKTIKKLLHDTKSGVKVRIMKRKTGNKVYVDAEDQDTFAIALTKLISIKENKNMSDTEKYLLPNEKKVISEGLRHIKTANFKKGTKLFNDIMSHFKLGGRLNKELDDASDGELNKKYDEMYKHLRMATEIFDDLEADVKFIESKTESIKESKNL